MRPRYEQKFQVLADHCLPGPTLDLGCSYRANPFLRETVGLDIVQPDECPQNYRKIVLCDLNWDPMPLEDESFDNVIAGDIIEHVENPSHLLRESNRVMKKDGRMIISTTQANDWWVTIHNWFLRSLIKDPDPGEHLQNWTITDMIRLLKKNGFAVEKVEGLFLHFPGLYLINIPFLTWRPRWRRFPQCAWQVVYVATKVRSPDVVALKLKPSPEQEQTA